MAQRSKPLDLRDPRDFAPWLVPSGTTEHIEHLSSKPEGNIVSLNYLSGSTAKKIFDYIYVIAYNKLFPTYNERKAIHIMRYLFL